MCDRDDIMVRLPAEISSHILSVLDAESLLACAAVNRAWDEMTNRLQPDVWFEACSEAGISVDPHQYEDATELKAFLSSMIPRLRDMKTWRGYSAMYCTYNRLIKAIYCRNEKIAIAFEDSVKILDTSSDVCYAQFECRFIPLLLKFDDSMLVAASASGFISIWSVASGQSFRNYVVDRATLLSLDFSTDYKFLVSSILSDDLKNDIYIWRITSGSEHRKKHVKNKTVHKVILAPDPRWSECKQSCFMFGLSEDCAFVWLLQYARGLIFVVNYASLPIPPSPSIDMKAIGLSPFGLLFDGHELFITTPSPERSSSIVWAWHFRQNTIRGLETRGRLLNLLGVGEKFLVYNARVEGIDGIHAVDKHINKEIAVVETMSIPSPSDEHICLGHTSWLDGLNGENDKGNVYACLTDSSYNVFLVKFAPRNDRNISYRTTVF